MLVAAWGAARWEHAEHSRANARAGASTSATSPSEGDPIAAHDSDMVLFQSQSGQHELKTADRSERSTDRSTERSTDRSTERSTDRSTERSTDRDGANAASAASAAKPSTSRSATSSSSGTSHRTDSRAAASHLHPTTAAR
jgi:hypothetical protein